MNKWIVNVTENDEDDNVHITFDTLEVALKYVEEEYDLTIEAEFGLVCHEDDRIKWCVGETQVDVSCSHGEN